MIDIAILPLYLLAVTALVVVPGPDFVLISSQSVSRGARYGIACAFGIFAAGMLQTLLVAAGLGKIMAMWPTVATVIRLGGAAYLAFLGIKLVLAWRRRPPGTHATPAAAPQRARSLLLVGLANNLLNPKALLFFSVFIPQFVNSRLGAPSLQIATLGTLLSALALAYNVLLACAFAALRSFRVNAPNFKRHSEGLLGVLFITLSARLAVAKAA